MVLQAFHSSWVLSASPRWIFCVSQGILCGSRAPLFRQLVLVSWVAADWAPLTSISGWLPWEWEHRVHWHILSVGYLVPNPQIFCSCVKTIRIFVGLQSYQHFQWTNMDIHPRQFLSSLTLKTLTTLQRKRTKPPGFIKWTMMEWRWKNSFDYRSLTAVKKRNLLFEVFRNSTSFVAESRESGLCVTIRGCFSVTQFLRLKG